MSEAISQNSQESENPPSEEGQKAIADSEVERLVAQELRRMSEEEGREARNDRMLRAGRGEVVEIYAVGLPHGYPPPDIG